MMINIPSSYNSIVAMRRQPHYRILRKRARTLHVTISFFEELDSRLYTYIYIYIILFAVVVPNGN